MPETYEIPETHRPYTDKYFLRTREILRAEGTNPRVDMQVFIRQGPGRVYGLEEAVALLHAFAAHGGDRLAVSALPEGAEYAPGEPLMRIEGPLADFVELETLYLGAVTAATSRAAGVDAPDPDAVRERAACIRALLPDKKLLYFGARHWRWDVDGAVSAAAVAGGFDACATDAGARAAGLAAGVGTIPHALVLAMAHVHGIENATREAALAFHRHMPPDVPRVALVDTFNRELDDSTATAAALGGALDAVRLDTAGENVCQGADPAGPPHLGGPGVTVSAARALRGALDATGRPDVDIVLSSGFGDLDKVRAFAEAERRHGRLFESLGVGGLYPARFATADIVRIEGRPLAKTGRAHIPNPRLRPVS